MALASRLGAAALALAILVGSASAQDKPAFVFTAIPDQDESRLVERFTKVAELLQAKLGVPVKYIPVKSYPAAVTAFTNNQVQLAWFGGFTGVQARRAVPGSRAIVQGAEDVAFKTYVIANAKTGLKPSKELAEGHRRQVLHVRGARLDLRPADAGALLPAGLSARRPRRSSPASASRAITAAPSSSCNRAPSRSASLDYSVWDTRAEGRQGRPGPGVGHLGEPHLSRTTNGRSAGTWTPPTAPASPRRLKATLLAIDDPTMLGYFARSKFIPAANEQYAPIEEVAKATDLFN